MIFLGDLACPTERVDDFNEVVDRVSVLSNEVIVLNLEAVILENGSNKESKLYNHPRALDSIIKNNKKVIVSLANNHMYDYPGEILKTKTYLENLGVGVFGLHEPDGLIKPFEYEDESGKYAMFGHCWDLYTHTNPNQENDVRVVDVDYGKFIEIVSNYIRSHTQRKVICFMHWNYDLEEYPFPMYRKFAHDLIDCGCEAIIGSHSHVIQPVEIYKNKPIAYCLGNFYLPSGIFFDDNLKYPTKSRNSLGIKIGEKPLVLKFESDTTSALKFLGSSPFEQYDNINGMTGKDYITMFKQNRVKKLFVPVFIDYHGCNYKYKRFIAIWRVNLIKILRKLM